MVVSAPSAEAPWFQHWLSSSSGFRSFLCSYLQDKDLMPYHQPEFKSWIHSFWPVWFENLYLRLSFYLIPESNLIWPSFSTGSITHWWNPVLNEMWDPTVPKLLKISRQQQQSIKPSVGPFWVHIMCNYTGHPPAKLASYTGLVGKEGSELPAECVSAESGSVVVTPALDETAQRMPTKAFWC